MPHLDHVTGLRSRGDLEAFFGTPAGAADDLAVAMIDVVGLKDVNAHDGFAAGDTCLRHAAGRLQDAAPDAAILARLGGDELVAVFVGAAAGAAAARTVARVGGGGAPRLRAAAVDRRPGEPATAMIDRLYAIVRRC